MSVNLRNDLLRRSPARALAVIAGIGYVWIVLGLFDSLRSDTQHMVAAILGVTGVAAVRFFSSRIGS